VSFLKDFDTLFNSILIDYKNQFPEADTSQGSLIYIKSACLASALWGLYRYQDYIAKQIFPDSSDTENLEHHAWIYELTRKTGETDAQLLARLLEHIRRPPAGGNKYDYEKWAMECDGVKAAYCIPLGQGPGTVDVIILSSGATEIPDAGLINTVKSHIDELRPVTASIVRVLAPTVITQDVTMTVTGTSLNIALIRGDIEAFMNNLIPDEDMALTQLSAIAINNGAVDVSITVPVANVTTTVNEMIRPGTINVS
jgi:uncharacterized phage protein gp47/JayE